MRQAVIKYNSTRAGVLTELDAGEYEFIYDEKYIAEYPHHFITFDMPVRPQPYRSKRLFGINNL